MPITEKSDSSFDNQLIPVIQKGVRSIIWILGIIIGLDNIGFDITAMIAGLELEVWHSTCCSRFCKKYFCWDYDFLRQTI